MKLQERYDKQTHTLDEVVSIIDKFKPTNWYATEVSPGQYEIYILANDLKTYIKKFRLEIEYLKSQNLALYNNLMRLEHGSAGDMYE